MCAKLGEHNLAQEDLMLLDCVCGPSGVSTHLMAPWWVSTLTGQEIICLMLPSVVAVGAVYKLGSCCCCCCFPLCLVFLTYILLQAVGQCHRHLVMVPCVPALAECCFRL